MAGVAKVVPLFSTLFWSVPQLQQHITTKPNLKEMEVFAIDIVQIICNLLDSKSLARLQQVNRFWKLLLDKHTVKFTLYQFKVVVLENCVFERIWKCGFLSFGSSLEISHQTILEHQEKLNFLVTTSLLLKF